MSLTLYVAEFFLALAQRAFIAADIAALPFALSFLFLVFVTLGSVDLGRPGPFFIAAPDSNARACCKLDISVSISTMMRFVSMNPPLNQHKRRTLADKGEPDEPPPLQCGFLFG
jgi:hypothetical protein